MSYSHIQIAIFYSMLILVDNIYIDIEDDMMQVFCALSWGVRPSSRLSTMKAERDCSLLCKEVSRLFDACGLVEEYINWSQESLEG